MVSVIDRTEAFDDVVAGGVVSVADRDRFRGCAGHESSIWSERADALPARHPRANIAEHVHVLDSELNSTGGFAATFHSTRFPPTDAGRMSRAGVRSFPILPRPPQTVMTRRGSFCGTPDWRVSIDVHNCFTHRCRSARGSASRSALFYVLYVPIASRIRVLCPHAQRANVRPIPGRSSQIGGTTVMGAQQPDDDGFLSKPNRARAAQSRRVQVAARSLGVDPAAFIAWTVDRFARAGDPVGRWRVPWLIEVTTATGLRRNLSGCSACTGRMPADPDVPWSAGSNHHPDGSAPGARSPRRRVR